MIKYIFSLIIVAVACSPQTGYAQQNKDSMIISFASVLQQQLTLSNAQVGQVIAIGRTEVAQLDSVNRQTLSTQNRQQEMKSIMTAYKLGMQSILTANQWQQYQLFMQQRRDNIMQKMKSNNAKTVELDSIKSN